VERHRGAPRDHLEQGPLNGCGHGDQLLAIAIDGSAPRYELVIEARAIDADKSPKPGAEPGRSHSGTPQGAAHDHVTTCPICGTSAPAGRASMSPGAARSPAIAPSTPRPERIPSCHDAVTTICPACERLSCPLAGRPTARGVRAAAYRRRRDTTMPPRRGANGSTADDHRLRVRRLWNRTLGEQYCASAAHSCRGRCRDTAVVR